MRSNLLTRALLIGLATATVSPLSYGANACAPDSALQSYRLALTAADAGDPEVAEQRLRQALAIRQEPTSLNGTCLGDAPYVPYLHLARLQLDAGAWDDAELSLAISDAFQAWRRHKPSRALAERVRDGIDARRVAGSSGDDRTIASR